MSVVARTARRLVAQGIARTHAVVYRTTVGTTMGKMVGRRDDARGAATARRALRCSENLYLPPPRLWRTNYRRCRGWYRIRCRTDAKRLELRFRVWLAKGASEVKVALV